MQGLILFAHGARDPRWAAPFDAVAAEVRARHGALALRVAYLEHLPPALDEAAAELVAAGCTRVDVLPMFLGAGGHVRRDLPRLIDELRAAHPGVAFESHGAIGEVPAVTTAMATAALAIVDKGRT